MSSETEQQRVEALEKRIQESQTQLDALKLAIEKLPQPTFTSDTHERIFDVAHGIGLSR